MISITITGDTPELIAAHVAWVAHRLGSVDIVEEVIERKEKKAAKSAEKAIEKASAAPSEPPAAPPAEEASMVTEPTTTLDYAKDVGPVMSRLLAEKGSGVVKELLGRFGAKKGAELAAKDLPLALEQAKELLGE